MHWTLGHHHGLVLHEQLLHHHLLLKDIRLHLLSIHCLDAIVHHHIGVHEGHWIRMLPLKLMPMHIVGSRLC